jgi:hypothetical protein
MLGDGMDAPGRVHIVVRRHGWSRSMHHGAAPLTTKLSGHALAADHAFEGVTVDRRHDPSPSCPFCRWAMPKRPILRKAARDFFT